MTMAEFTNWLNTFINSIGILGPIVACILIMIESIMPILPLCLFIIILFLTFGNLIGFLLSWLFTIIGCIFAFSIVRNKFQSIFDRKVRANKKINSLMNKVDKWSLQQIVIILAIPFTPAFAVNIAAGLSNIDRKKYFSALVISKAFMVYFWGYLGVSFVECLTNPKALIKVVLMVFCAYIISFIVNKKFKLN